MWMRSLIAAVAVGVCASMAAAQEAGTKVLRFGYGLQEQSNQGRAARFFAEEVDRLSGGKLQIRPIGAGGVGGDVHGHGDFRAEFLSNGDDAVFEALALVGEGELGAFAAHGLGDAVGDGALGGQAYDECAFTGKKTHEVIP